MNRFGSGSLPGQLKALDAIRRCRTPQAGEVYVQCPDCNHGQWQPLSCGNRHCPKCLHHQTSLWLDRQLGKLMPVSYFMVSFTLPYELRTLAFGQQRLVYSLMMQCAAEVLRKFGANHKHLGAEIGMTMVLHTHARDLSFHPHVHVLIPGGGINKRWRRWIRLKTKYLFNGFALAKSFRYMFLKKGAAAGLAIPATVPAKWVAHCEYMGSGMPALKYLARYLYRGVISEKNIVANRNGKVTFRYLHSKTGEFRYRTLRGEEFLYLYLQHVLPRGFRRTRDLGFLHGNAKKLLTLLQLILRVHIQRQQFRRRPSFVCPCCKTQMVFVYFRFDYDRSG